jgi:hypothetical protein
MFYQMKIYAEINSEVTPLVHSPIIVETTASEKSKVTDREIELVADAFRAQVKDALLLMLGRPID